LCKQEEQSKPEGELKDMAEEKNKEELPMEIRLARCQEENESLRQQIMKVEAAHRVS
jgi:hypothetical protein